MEILQMSIILKLSYNFTVSIYDLEQENHQLELCIPATRPSMKLSIDFFMGVLYSTQQAGSSLAPGMI